MKASFAVAAILSILALAPSASTQQMRSFQCIATSVARNAPHITIYVSQLIPMELSEHTALAGAWATYIKATYHTATISSTACQPFGMNSTMQEQALAAEETAWKRQGWEVVHVTWRPGQSASSSAASIYSAAPGPGGAAAPPASAAPPSAPAISTGPEPRASYCFSDEHKPTIYLSDPFDTAGLPSSAAWSTAFTKFLAQKYTATRERSPAKTRPRLSLCKVWSWISATMPGRTSRSSTPTGPTNRPRLPPRRGRSTKRPICRRMAPGPGLELEPNCGRERSGSPQAKSRAI